MLSSLLALAMVMQSDPTRATREAFNNCLRQFVEASLRARKTQEQFNTEYPTVCAAEQTAYRQAVMARETGLRATRANAEQSANDAVEESRTNFAERFAMDAPRNP